MFLWLQTTYNMLGCYGYRQHITWYVAMVTDNVLNTMLLWLQTTYNMAADGVITYMRGCSENTTCSLTSGNYGDEHCSIISTHTVSRTLIAIVRDRLTII